MNLRTKRFGFLKTSWAIIFFVKLISSAPILAQSTNYCDTSSYREVNIMYNDALFLDALNKPGAIPLLKRTLKIDTAFASAYFKLGEIYHKKAIASQYDIQNQSNTRYYFRKASDNFLYAIELCESIENYAAYFYLGEQFYNQNEFALAGYYLNNYLKNCSENAAIYKLASQYYSNYLKWKWWKENPYPISIYQVHNLCSEKDEMFPFITANGQFFYFTRKYNRQKPNSVFIENIQELYMSSIQSIDSNENWIFTKGTKLKEFINDSIQYKEIYANVENTQLYLSNYYLKKSNNNYIDAGTIYFSVNEGGYWDTPIKIFSTLNSGTIYDGQPCLSHDGNKLLFTSNRPDGFGGTDLYYSEKNKDGYWSEPINLGSTINTINDEKTPFLHYDSKTLYFTSNGHFGIGGFDIYVSRLDNEGNWGKPENLGQPINTASNETGLILDARGIKGYFASNSLQGSGGWDIFCVDIPKKFRPNEMILLNGKISDNDSVSIPNFTVEVYNTKTNKKFVVLTNSESSTFSSIIPKEDYSYYIKVESKGYSFGNQLIEGSQNSHTYFADIELIKLKTGSKFYLPHAYFDANSNIEFNTLGIFSDFATYLKKESSLKIKILGLTKNQSPTESFQSLIKKSDQLRLFLIQKGISESRISVKSDTLIISNIPSKNPTNSEILIEVTEY